jgi:hypothetical protein
MRRPRNHASSARNRQKRGESQDSHGSSPLKGGWPNLGETLVFLKKHAFQKAG